MWRWNKFHADEVLGSPDLTYAFSNALSEYQALLIVEHKHQILMVEYFAWC